MQSADSEQALGHRVDDALPSIIVGYRDGVTIPDLVGEHDLTTAHEIGFRIAEQAALGRGVVVSSSETDFMNSSVLRMLFRGDRDLIRRGRRLVLHTGNCERPVERVFEPTGMSDMLSLLRLVARGDLVRLAALQLDGDELERQHGLPPERRCTVCDECASFMKMRQASVVDPPGVQRLVTCRQFGAGRERHRPSREPVPVRHNIGSVGMGRQE